MEDDGRFIMQKTMDWSLLNDGMIIPMSACALMKAWDESILTHMAGKDTRRSSYTSTFINYSCLGINSC